VVALARHPFDVLISILHFAPNEPDTARWLNGEGGDERPIYGLTPRSPGFLDYAVSARVRALLSVSRDWWQDPRAHRLRYEHLVADYRYTLGQLVEMLGVPPLRGVSQAIELISLDWLRQHDSPKQHYWQGRPGLWRSLLTAADARRLAEVHGDHLNSLGYACDPDEALDGPQAEANWCRIATPERCLP
jgi:hypothetical protein